MDEVVKKKLFNIRYLLAYAVLDVSRADEGQLVRKHRYFYGKDTATSISMMGEAFRALILYS